MTQMIDFNAAREVGRIGCPGERNWLAPGVGRASDKTQGGSFSGMWCVIMLVLITCPCMAGEQVPVKEKSGMEIRTYESSQAPSLKLTAEFHVPDVPKPLCLNFHGFSSDAAYARNQCRQRLAKDFFVVNVDMRGRGGSGGNPDASGHELIDGLDALEFARKTWPTKVRTDAGPYVIGGSGGGGNVLALVGKAPDMFGAAAEWAGMSDYAVWYQGDTKRQWRGRMEGWIGKTPEANPEGYYSRGGLHLIPNVLSPLLVVHGTQDVSVPVAHAQNYKQKAEELGKGNIVVHFNDKGHRSEEFHRFLAFFAKHAAAPPKLPPKGNLLVHSFLACQRFGLVLDHPSRIGVAAYETASNGDLRSLTFSQAATQTPVKEVVVRLNGDIAQVSVETKGNRQAVERWRQWGSWSEFKVAAGTPWTIRPASDGKQP